MSKYFSEKFNGLQAYVPGEQPKDVQYVKLNTNELPFAPPKSVVQAMQTAGAGTNLYSDPTCSALVESAAKVLGVKPTQILPTNGSDEILNFAFMAFCDEKTPAVFADLTYGFYSVFADLHRVEKKIIPLTDDFSIDPAQYFQAGGTVFIANPNAPTGKALTRAQVEEIVKNNPDNVVVIDEAYVDFGGETCLPLIDKYDNLLITRTFSKSGGLAGARLGLGIASESLIADLNIIKYSTNPYNVNAVTMAAGVAALHELDHYKKVRDIIVKNRMYTAEKLKAMGFAVLPSQTNFLFIKSDEISGEELYQKLKERGVLVRHFKGERTSAYNRVSIGTLRQMDAFLTAVRRILTEKKA